MLRWSVIPPYYANRLAVILIGLSLLMPAEGGRKKNISVGEARAAVGEVAALQQFPDNYRFDKMGHIRVEDDYFPLFATYLARARRWRTLVFNNAGDYLGYYETTDEPVELNGEELIYPGPDYSAESGDDAEGQFDYGTAYIIRFNAEGPPDEIKFEDKTFTFVSSPKRILPDNPAYRFVRVANRLGSAINRGSFASIHQAFNKRAAKRLSKEQTKAAFSNLRNQMGRIVRIESPWIQNDHVAVFPVIFDRGMAGMKLTLDREDRIAGLSMLPFKTAFPDLGAHTTPITLPFEGNWRVAWGGGSQADGKYFSSRCCRYALEFVVSNRFGKTYRGKGRRNKDYFAYGQYVRAPAAGTVVEVINSVPENKPRSPNPFDRLGNAVMIQHSTNEFSVIGHLLKNTITLNVGDKVQARQKIGRCGNSGDSSQPSIYYHLQDSPLLLGGAGYRPSFDNVYLRAAKKVEVKEQYAPRRGDFVQQRSVRPEASAAGQGGKAE